MKRMIWGMTLSALLAAGSAEAMLESRAGGQAVYDTAQNITWVADANLAATHTFGVSGIGTYNPGDMTWDKAQEWIGAMNTASYLGRSDWRLPLTAQPDASCSGQTSGQSWGWGCTGSEMGHLANVDGILSSSPGSFSNVQFGVYQPYLFWSGTVYAPDSGVAWDFSFVSGGQGAGAKGNSSHAWAVRPGDIAAVPAPGALWLFGTGVVALGGKLKRRARGAGTAA